MAEVFSDCSPVKGTYKGTSNHTLEVGVSVSYEDGLLSKDISPTLKPQAPSTIKTEDPNANNNNSYRRHVQMMQQQQQ
ncbi:MAG: hypothetical protein WDM71_01290 [Ferruginibacter sp.]